MDLEGIFEQIIRATKTKEEKDVVLEVLREFIEQTRSAEREFNEMLGVFTLVLESLPIPIWVIDESDQSYFYFNSKAKNIDGILAKIPPNVSECEILYERESYLIQKTSKGGKTLITATNITNEKRKERLASMGQVSAHLAHEIRNPLGAISLILSTLSKSVDVKNKLHILEMKKSLWRVERLINATLLFSKGVKANLQTHSSEIIKEAIMTSIEYCEYAKQTHFTYEIAEREIVCDEELLEILLQNLILNALDAIDENDDITEGTIKVEFIKRDGAQIINIYDNGIPVSDKEGLFEAFKTSKIKGNGLGLALSQQIALAHNGAISYHCENAQKYFSVNLGKGVGA